MTSIEIEILPDRWIVRDRASRVATVDLVADQRFQLTLESGLALGVDGPWVGRQGSPVTGRRVKPDSQALINTRVLSLVLFETGTLRLVLSSGLTVVARAADRAAIRVEAPGVFVWSADAGGVENWRA